VLASASNALPMRADAIDMTNPDSAHATPLPLYELIYAVLRAHLVDGSFPPGLVLSESVVARAFGSSRTPTVNALRRLRDEGLIQDLDGFGYLAGRTTAPPIRRELADIGLRLPPDTAANLKIRNHHGRIYPDAEHAVAACLAYGRFLVNESALAEYYGVSRTVAHEILTRLERTGLIAQDVNKRWYAGPLTAERLSEHFEMRWLLEPTALGQAMDRLDRTLVARCRDRVLKAQRRPLKPGSRERLEIDLHVDIVRDCNNAELQDAIRRSQLPLIATHSTFARQRYPDEIDTMLKEHLDILDHVLAGRKAKAMRALEAHIRRSLPPNVERLKRLGRLPPELARPYLVQMHE
jgi:DNA-binding GntR family transcriptional regulator